MIWVWERAAFDLQGISFRDPQGPFPTFISSTSASPSPISSSSASSPILQTLTCSNPPNPHLLRCLLPLPLPLPPPEGAYLSSSYFSRTKKACMSGICVVYIQPGQGATENRASFHFLFCLLNDGVLLYDVRSPLIII